MVAVASAPYNLLSIVTWKKTGHIKKMCIIMSSQSYLYSPNSQFLSGMEETSGSATEKRSLAQDGQVCGRCCMYGTDHQIHRINRLQDTSNTFLKHVKNVDTGEQLSSQVAPAPYDLHGE